jgi:CDP-diacylglycerol---serine O-phosphatidyltransferase
MNLPYGLSKSRPVQGIKNRRPPRAAYALPTFFTAGNIFFGFVSIMQSFEGAMQVFNGQTGPNGHFELAAKMIGIAVLLDGLDGRIARMTNTVSDFGRELDSLADSITFGLAPAVLAFAWGVVFVNTDGSAFLKDHIVRAGYFIAFIYLLCGCARLARFNVTTNPVPKNPGRPDRKYFVGLAIPAAAGAIAAIVYASNSVPLQDWRLVIGWMALQFMLALLMISTWRYYSFKELNLLAPRSPLMVVLLGSLIYLIFNYSQAVLLLIAVVYVGSGIVTRIGGAIRRNFRARQTA